MTCLVDVPWVVRLRLGLPNERAEETYQRVVKGSYTWPATLLGAAKDLRAPKP